MFLTGDFLACKTGKKRIATHSRRNLFLGKIGSVSGITHAKNVSDKFVTRAGSSLAF